MIPFLAFMVGLAAGVLAGHLTHSLLNSGDTYEDD